LVIQLGEPARAEWMDACVDAWGTRVCDAALHIDTLRTTEVGPMKDSGGEEAFYKSVPQPKSDCRCERAIASR
jgi:hypothetical protein